MRTTKKALLGLLLVANAQAATVSEIQAVLATGGAVTVGKEFAGYEINGFLASAPGRVTVTGAGFPLYEVQGFLSRGAKVVVDPSFQAWEIKRLVAAGKKRVILASEGFQPHEYLVWNKLGATVVQAPVPQGSTQLDRMAALRAGGMVICDKSMPAYEVSALLAVARERVTVTAKGFEPYEISQFLSQGAKVQVDRAFAAHDVWSFCAQGKDRVTVQADGFESFEINGFASQGAKIAYEAAKAERSVARMTSLHGQ